MGIMGNLPIIKPDSASVVDGGTDISIFKKALVPTGQKTWEDA